MNSQINFELPDQFPIGLRVLAIDSNKICLRILERILVKYQCQVTAIDESKKALELLKYKEFDLIISDIDMPDIDGFTLLELILLETNIPLIILSSNTDTKLMIKSITQGARDYLLKPLRFVELLKSIWLNVTGKEKVGKNSENCDEKRDEILENNVSDELVTFDENNLQLERKRKADMVEIKDSKSSKKHRVVWTTQLHKKFVESVEQLGIKKAVPKKVLELMNIENLTRENVASHLQKYRIQLTKTEKENQPDNNMTLVVRTDSDFQQTNFTLVHRPEMGYFTQNVLHPTAMFPQNPNGNHNNAGNIVQTIPTPVYIDHVRNNNLVPNSFLPHQQSYQQYHQQSHQEVHQQSHQQSGTSSIPDIPSDPQYFEEDQWLAQRNEDGYIETDQK